MQRNSASPCTNTCNYFIVYTICERACALCAFKGLRVGHAWHQPPYAGKYNPSPTLRLNKLKLQCPSRKNVHENGSCSALRSGECNHWYLRTNKVAFHTLLTSAVPIWPLGCTSAFFSCCVAFYVSKLHGSRTNLLPSLYIKGGGKLISLDNPVPKLLLGIAGKYPEITFLWHHKKQFSFGA